MLQGKKVLFSREEKLPLKNLLSFSFLSLKNLLSFSFLSLNNLLSFSFLYLKNLLSFSFARNKISSNEMEYKLTFFINYSLYSVTGNKDALNLMEHYSLYSLNIIHSLKTWKWNKSRRALFILFTVFADSIKYSFTRK